ncbi:hypothetical protein LOK49_LG03G02790 [Camellia lanceoleosa]|uniref:Uncharacterized protein n=1 Tax=Camellia lanceoleosa TaxID=1840588 RepID=A0ACC0IBF1_9ERIC|nr:hypothetical protein LOK49_LG03G02790 [Camellia lanceoleosa]
MKQFIDHSKCDPTILGDPSLSFFRDYLKRSSSSGLVFWLIWAVLLFWSSSSAASDVACMVSRVFWAAVFSSRSFSILCQVGVGSAGSRVGFASTSAWSATAALLCLVCCCPGLHFEFSALFFSILFRFGSSPNPPPSHFLMYSHLVGFDHQ